MIMRLYANGFRGKNIPEMLYGYRADQANYAHRTFRSRIDEMIIRYEGYKANHILLSWGWLFILWPIPAYFYQIIKNILKIHSYE